MRPPCGSPSTTSSSTKSRPGSTCGGQPVALAPKPFAVLCALARTPQMLVTKNALLDAVWGHRFVTESVLKSAISEVRAALGDDPKQPRYIETVSRRGYRFIAAPVAAPVAKRCCRRAQRRRPSRSDSAHGTVPRRCRSGRAHPRASLPRSSASGLSSTSSSAEMPHETIRAMPERSTSPAHRGDRRPARVRAIPAPANAVAVSGCGPTWRWPSCRSSPGQAAPPARTCTKR